MSARRILLFPFGNNVDFASFYLEQGYDEEGEKPIEGWYACVQFTLVLWNKHDPSIYTLHSKNRSGCSPPPSLLICTTSCKSSIQR